MEIARDKFFPVAMWTFVGDNAGVAANGVAIDGVIYAEVSHIGIVHGAYQSLERGNIFGRVAVHFDIGDMPRVANGVVRSLDTNLIARADWEINGNVAGIGHIRAVGDAFYSSVNFSIGTLELPCG